MKDNLLPAYDIIVVGGSAGAVEGFQTLVRALPADFQAAIFFVLHIPVDYPSVLPKILSRAGSLPAEHPIDGEPVRHGRVYVAPPDRHLMLEDGVVRVKRGPRENRHRPAIDPLFRTAARVFGPRVIGVIMSGQMDDGAAGLHVIRSRGGIAIVQDPGDSASRDMPQSALEYGNVDYVLPASEIGPLLVKLVNKCAGDTMVERKKNGHKAEDNVEQNRTASTPEDGVGKPSTFSCPECHGVLWEVKEGNLVRFRCRVGHAFTMASLVEEQDQSVENAFWAAMRALDEKAALNKRLADSSSDARMAARLREQAEDDHANATLIRNLLFAEEKELKPAG